jgi:flagellar hook assembly protein FlgD
MSLPTMTQSVATATTVTLFPCLPNPFSQATVLAFRASGVVEWRLRIVDRRGRAVHVFSGQDSGVVTLVWHGDDLAGSLVPEGTYYAELSAGVGTVRRRLILMRQ